MQQCIRELRSRCKSTYIFNCVECSQTQVTMLAVTVRRDGSDLVVVPRDKPFAPPLDATSAHHPSVHKWPVASIKHVSALCSTEQDVMKERVKVLNNFKAAGRPCKLIQQMQDVIDGVDGIDGCVRAKKPLQAGSCSWLTLPFYPNIKYKSVSRAVSMFCSSSMYNMIYQSATGLPVPVVRVGWKNVRNHLCLSFRHSARSN